jgi:O-antigen ligase
MTAAAPARIARYGDSAGRAAFVVLGVSIPVSVALDGILVGVILLAWLAAQRYRETFLAVRENPVALAACVWLAIHVIGAAYSVGTSQDIGRSINKAAMFLLIPAAAVLMTNARDRERALEAFCAVIVATVLLSFLRSAGAIPPQAPLLKDVVFSPSIVFKYHLTQNLLVAFGAFVLAVLAQRATSRNRRYVLAALAVLAVINVIFIGDGRTGQLVLLSLIVYFGYWCARVRGVLIAMGIAAILVGASYLMPQSSLHKRAATGVGEAIQWQPGVTTGGDSSIGDRLEFYKRSIDILGAHPLAGVGTGGFAVAYEEEVKGIGVTPTRNPHSEYLLKGVEFGMPGIFLLLALFWTVWRNAARLPDAGHTAIARALALTFAVASLVTSTFNDHTEGLLFVWLAGVLFSTFPHARTRRDFIDGQLAPRVRS